MAAASASGASIGWREAVSERREHCMAKWRGATVTIIDERLGEFELLSKETPYKAFAFEIPDNCFASRVVCCLSEGVKMTTEDLPTVNQMLLSAVRTNREAMLFLALELGADPHFNSTMTVLSWVVWPKDINLLLMDDLMEAGADMTIRAQFGKSNTFDLAASKDKVDVMAILFERNRAILSEVNDNEQTSLHIAAYCGSIGAIEFICEKDPSLIDHRDCEGNTPLHEAVKILRKEACQRLIELGADPEIPNGKGETPLDIAKEEDEMRMKFHMGDVDDEMKLMTFFERGLKNRALK